MHREVRQIGNTGEWLNWRRGDITASRIAALFDEHPYLSFDQLVCQMLGEQQGQTSAMRRGRILEPAVLEALREDHKELGEIVKATTYHRLPEHRIGCTPDAWAGTDALVQVKTVAPMAWEKWHGKPHLAYLLQTLTEMMVTGKEQGYLAVMILTPSYPVHLYPVARNEAAEQRIIDAVAKFWEGFDADSNAIVPQTETGAELAELLDDGSHVDLSTDNEIGMLLADRACLKLRMSLDEKAIKGIDASIKEKIGAASTAHVPGWLLTYRAIQRKEFTVAAKTVRTLLIKPINEEADE